jgi:phosphoglycolate phosphatase
MPNLPAALQALIFDFDGTLAAASYDFDAMRAGVRALAADHGVTAADLDGLHVLEAVARAADLIGRETLAGRAFRESAERLILDLELRGARHASLLPGVEPALAALRRAGLRIAVVTRNSHAAIDTIAGVAGLACDAFLTREQTPRVKPHPEHLLRALDALGADPQHAAMVGDHPMDVTAGKAAGVTTIGVLTGAGTRESLAAAGADLIVGSVVELAPMLTGAADD